MINYRQKNPEIVSRHSRLFLSNLNFFLGIIAKKFLKYTSDKRRNLKMRRALFKSSGKYLKKKVFKDLTNCMVWLNPY